MSVEDKDNTQAHGDVVDHVGSDRVSDFFKACEGRVKPVILRDEMVHAAVMSPAAWNALPPIYQIGIQHAERWLEEFAGQDHTVQCVACGEHIDCEADNHHQEVGALACLFKADLDLTIGGLVFAICTECTSKHPDNELYLKMVEGLGGEKSDIVTGKHAPDRPEHDAILKTLAETTTKSWANYCETGDLETYLKVGLDALNAALASSTALKTPPAVEAANTETQPKPVSQEDVNLLVGEG